MRWPSVSTAALKPCKRVSGVPTNVRITVRRRRGVSDTAGTQQISRPNAHGCVLADRRSTHRWQNSVLKPVKRVPMSVTSTITITVRCVPAYCEIVPNTVATWHRQTALLRSAPLHSALLCDFVYKNLIFPSCLGRYETFFAIRYLTDLSQREVLNSARATVSTRMGPDRNRTLHRFPRVHQARPVLLGDFVQADRQHRPYRAGRLSG